MSISNETANQLLNGKFKTFYELDSFNRKNRTAKNKVHLLYKEKFNTNKADYDYIIETIFINE